MGDTQGLFTEDPLLMWRVRPNLERKRYSTNSGGFRDREFPRKKEPGEFRIIVLGDSTSWGWGVPDGAPYPRILEELLAGKEKTGSFEVLNGGMPGYTSFQGMLLFRTELSRYSPDLVITYFGVNDCTSRQGIKGDADRGLPPLWLVGVMRFLRKSMLYSDARRAALLIAGGKDDKQHTPGEYRQRVTPEEFRGNISEIEESAADRGAEVLNITPAWNFAGEIRSDVSKVVFGEKGALVEYFDRGPVYRADPSVDLAGVLARAGLEPGYLFLDYCHLSPTGHRLLAEELTRRIAEDFIGRGPAAGGERASLKK